MNYKLTTLLLLTITLTPLYGNGLLFQVSKEAKTQSGFIKQDVVQMAAQDPNLQSFVFALQATGLDHTLRGPGPYTIFAPNNEAFKKFGMTKFSNLSPENKAHLKEILLYHIVPGKMMSTDLETATVPTANGRDLKIQVSGSEIRVNGAHVVEDDIDGSNGVIHVINEVLIP